MSTDPKEVRRAELQAELAALDEPAPADTTVDTTVHVDEPAAAFPQPGEAWDPTQQPPPDAAIGSGADWQQPEGGGDPTAPPPSAPVDPMTAATEGVPEDTVVSETTYDVVAGDGSTIKNTPGYSHLPCPVCRNTSLKTANVQAAQPVVTLKGETVNPGDQAVVCESCGNTIALGDADRFEQDAHEGVYGEELKTAAEGGTAAEAPDSADVTTTPPPVDSLDAIAAEETRLATRLQQLAERRDQLEAQQAATPEGGGEHGNG